MIKLVYGSDNSDIRYKTGFSFGDPVFFVDTGKKNYLYLNNLELDHAKKENKDPNLVICSIHPLVKKALENKDKTVFKNKLALLIITSSKTKGKKVTIPADFPVDIADYLRKNKIILSVSHELYPERKIKTKKETKIIQSILKRMIKAFDQVEEILKKSKIEKGKIVYKGKQLTSEFIKQEIDSIFLKHNLQRTRENIVSSGLDTAIPHHHGKDEIMPHTPIVVDLFPKDEKTGYFGDMTRTYVKGKPSQRIKEMYDSVFLAQKEALKKIKAGVKASDIHKICEEVFKKNGFDTKSGEGFIHTTGHGLGLELHEKPSVGNSEEILEEGNIITIEPGLYYERFGGIRIEDVVLVTKSGYKNLTSYSKNFIIL